MANERRQEWLDEIARLRLAYPEIKLLAKHPSRPDVPHEAPQFEFGPWVVSGAKHSTFVVLRWKDGSRRPVPNPPARWKPPQGKREAGDWLHRVDGVLGQIDELLAELSVIAGPDAGQSSAKTAPARVAANPDIVVETPPDLDEASFPEGERSYRLHAHRERSPALVQSAKEQRMLTEGRLECEACGFDFNATYGAHGHGFIEAHHILPVSQMEEGAQTRLEDLALVCSNCHRMLHRGEPPTVEELRKILGKPPRPRGRSVAEA